MVKIFIVHEYIDTFHINTVWQLTFKKCSNPCCFWIALIDSNSKYDNVILASIYRLIFKYLLCFRYFTMVIMKQEYKKKATETLFESCSRALLVIVIWIVLLFCFCKINLAMVYNTPVIWWHMIFCEQRCCWKTKSENRWLRISGRRLECNSIYIEQ